MSIARHRHGRGQHAARPRVPQRAAGRRARHRQPRVAPPDADSAWRHARGGNGSKGAGRRGFCVGVERRGGGLVGRGGGRGGRAGGAREGRGGERCFEGVSARGKASVGAPGERQHRGALAQRHAPPQGPRRRVPDLDGVVIPARRERGAVGREAHARDDAAVPLHGAVGARGPVALAHAGVLAGVALHPAALRPSRDVHETHGPVSPRGGHRRPIRREAHGQYLRAVPLELAHDTPGFDVPHAHDAVPPAGGEGVAVGREGEGVDAAREGAVRCAA
mmetsp:Transcript_50439/g.119973  ORF Transcript_50439/g.119973 Transcript_50439/m.119973 type:complete len:277 (-) Transcript_50439:524-1354(-)